MSISTTLPIGLLVVCIVPATAYSVRAELPAIDRLRVARLPVEWTGRGTVALLTGVAVEAQAPETGAVPFRPLESFRYLHIPVPPGDQGKLNRELLKQIRPQRDKLWPVPFGWKIEPSVPSDAGTDFLMASVRPHPSIKAGVVVAFTDVNGRPIAVVEGRPAPLRRTSAASIISVVFDLLGLGYQTRGAGRLVGSFRALRLRTASAGTDALREYIARGLRQHGPWAVVDAASEFGETEAADILDCSLEVPISIPATARLRCEDVNARPVVMIVGSNCRSCYGPFQFSADGDTRRAGDDLVKKFIEHHVRMERIYAPQLRGAR